MKLTVLFKMPDAIGQVQDYFRHDEEDEEEEGEEEKAIEIFGRYVAFGENLTVVIDTDEGTLTATPLKE